MNSNNGLTANDSAQSRFPPCRLGLVSILEQRTSDHGSTSWAHAIVVEFEDLESRVRGDKLEPARRESCQPGAEERSIERRDTHRLSRATAESVVAEIDGD